MARFFFNFRQGERYTVDDSEGVEFRDSGEAYLGAFKAAQQMWSELLAQRQDPLLCAFEIIDGGGNSLFILPFSEVLDACRGRASVAGGAMPLPALLQALESRRIAQQSMREVAQALDSARATLKETMILLKRVNRILDEP